MKIRRQFPVYELGFLFILWLIAFSSYFYEKNDSAYTEKSNITTFITMACVLYTIPSFLIVLYRIFLLNRESYINFQAIIHVRLIAIVFILFSIILNAFVVFVLDFEVTSRLFPVFLTGTPKIKS